MPRKKGTYYSREIGQKICEQLADGRSLRSICADQGMPGRTAVFRWLATDDDFRTLYVRARQMQADTLFDEALEIADDATNDWMQSKSKPGQVVNRENINRSKLRIDTRKWMVAKLSPKKYGEKIEVSGNGEAPLVTKVVREIVKAGRKKGQ